MKLVIKTIFYVIAATLMAYLTFFAVQGILESFTKVGNTLIINWIGDYAFSYLEIFLLPATAVYLYRSLFVEKKYLRSFHLHNGIYHIVLGSLCFVFNLWALIKFRNWGRGATYLYPADFLVFNLIALATGIFSVSKASKENKTDKTMLKSRRAFNNIFVYCFSFLALDRFGVVLNSFLSGNFLGGPVLIPIYLLCLCPVAGIACYFAYVHSKNTITKNRIWIYSAYTITLVTLFCSLYEIIMSYVGDSTAFIKIISPFYGADRLIAKPITILLVPVVILIACIFSIVYFYSARRKMTNVKKEETSVEVNNQETEIKETK